MSGEFVEKPEIDEKVKNIIELISKNGNKSIIEYILTLDQYNTLDQYKEKQAEILNYLLIWAIREQNKDIINILIDKKNAKLNTDFEEDSEIVRSVVRNLSFYVEVIENIRKSIVPEITKEDLIEDYTNNQKSPEEDEPPKQAANLQIRGAEKVQHQSVKPPTFPGWFSFFPKPANLSAGGGGGKPKQYGGFRKKHKNSKYKTKKFKKIYKKKKHNRKTRKYK